MIDDKKTEFKAQNVGSNYNQIKMQIIYIH